MSGCYKNNPRCEVCGTHKYPEEELLHLMDFDDYHPGEFEGMEACPDCVFEIFTMHRNPITGEPIQGVQNNCGDTPKPPITQVRALYPMRKHHHKEYNIFPLPDGQYEGRVFDRNRRIDYKTHAIPTPDKAILVCRGIAELLGKSQCVPEGMAIHVDEGKAIREKEDKEYQDFKKAQRKKKG